MNKFLNFVKKPLIIISGAVFGVFLIMLIVVCALPHGKTYSYSFEMMNQHLMDIEMDFDKDTIFISMEYDEDLAKEEGIPESQRYVSVRVDYEIRNGKLYTREEDSTTFEYGGEINSFKITMSGDEMGISFNDLKIELVCTTNVALRTISIVFMIVSGIVLVGSLVILVLDKKGILKSQTNGESVEEQVSEDGQAVDGIAESNQEDNEAVKEETDEGTTDDDEESSDSEMQDDEETGNAEEIKNDIDEDATNKETN